MIVLESCDLVKFVVEEGAARHAGMLASMLATSQAVRLPEAAEDAVPVSGTAARELERVCRFLALQHAHVHSEPLVAIRRVRQVSQVLFAGKGCICHFLLVF